MIIRELYTGGKILVTTLLYPKVTAKQKQKQWPSSRLAKNKETSIDTDAAFVITDNYNPLESLQVSKAEQYRALLVQRLGKEILIR